MLRRVQRQLDDGAFLPDLDGGSSLLCHDLLVLVFSFCFCNQFSIYVYGSYPVHNKEKGLTPNLILKVKVKVDMDCVV